MTAWSPAGTIPDRRRPSPPSTSRPGRVAVADPVTGLAPGMPAPHPIEVESYRIIDERIDLSGWDPPARAAAARVTPAPADTGYGSPLRLTAGAVAAGVAALRAGAPVVADVEMVAVATRRSG